MDELLRGKLEDEPPFTSLNLLVALTQLYNFQGCYEEAESFLIRALNIAQRWLGDEHPYMADLNFQMALLLAATNRSDKAKKQMLRVTQILNGTIGQIFATSSENNCLNYLEGIRAYIDVFLSLVYRKLSYSGEAKQAALDVVLSHKALTATVLAARNQALWNDRYPYLSSQFQELQSLSHQIIHLTQSAYFTFSPPKPEELISYQQRLTQLQTRYEQLQKKLALLVPDTQLQQQLQTADRCAVALELPEGTVLVEFVRFDVFDFNAVYAREEAIWQPAHYLAFVLPAKQPDQVQMIDLGSADHIDQLIQNFRFSVFPDARGQLEMGATDGPPSFMEWDPEAAIELYETLFDRIRPALGENKHLLLAPDGDLNLVPFQILPTDRDGKRLLMDEYTISFLSVGRDVLRFSTRVGRLPSAPLVIADPDFDLAADPIAQAPTQPPSPSVDFKHSLLATVGKPFEPVPGTRLLGEAIAKKLGVSPYLGADALASCLTACQSPSLLLVGTHGVFFPDSPHNPPPPGRILSGLNSWAVEKIENPLLRSGLALAGANTWLLGGSPPPEAGTGFFFAQEVADLDLWSNELTVLSACNTARGDIKIGEGVFGLRRAFTVAGAKTLVMSLGSVPDLTTTMLMERFFENLQMGLGRAAALQKAQNYLRTITVRELRQQLLGKEVLEDLLGVRVDPQESFAEDLEKAPPLQHPYYWGAWICQGDTAPLVTSLLTTATASDGAGK